MAGTMKTETKWYVVVYGAWPPIEFDTYEEAVEIRNLYRRKGIPGVRLYSEEQLKKKFSWIYKEN